jgi:bacteriorhodopsin
MRAENGKKQGSGTAERRLSKFQEYLYANLFFWAFLVVVAVISFFTCGGVWDSVTSGTLQFLFFILGGGFTLVSVLDWVYEKYNAGDESNKSS